MTRALSESLEDYLEAIYHIVVAKQAARAKDISRRMGVSQSSVTGALHALTERGLVNHAPYDLVTLTAGGRAAAEDIVHRHGVLKGFLVSVLAVEEGAADEIACKMEHHIRGTVLRRLGYLGQFIAECPRADSDQWLRRFLEFCRQQEEAVGPRAERAT